MSTINLHTWFIDRELTFCPPHFVKTRTIANKENIGWIKEKLIGRFTFVPSIDGEYVMGEYSPAFEDPKEAVLYELTWS